MNAKSPKELASALLKAATVGDAATVKELLASGAKPDQRVTGKPTPLIAAATRGHIETVRALLRGGVDPSFKHGGKNGTTALLEAIQHDQFKMACELVAAGPDVHHDWSGEGQNITYEAIEKCNDCYDKTVSPPINALGIVRKRKEVEEKKAKENLPLVLKLLRMILDTGGKPGRPCLASTAGYGNIPVIRLLLAHGTDVNEQEKYASTPFAYAVGQYQQAAAIELLKAGADPNLGETLFGPPFHTAVREGMKELVLAIVKAGADLNHRGTITLDEPEEELPSATKPSPRFVLNLGTEHVNKAKACDSTPLIVAVRAGQTEIVTILVNAKAPLETMDADGFTALAWALKRDRTKIASILRKAGAKEPRHLEGSPFNVLINACLTGDIGKAKAAIAAGADVNAAKGLSKKFLTPLMCAAREGHLTIVDALLNAGANPNLAGSEALLMIVGPLMLAARHGHLEIVKRLVVAGAMVDAPERSLLSLRDKGDSAIHEAARNGHAQVVEFLLQAGVSPSVKSAWSSSLLVAAAQSGSVETVNVLLAAGASPLSKDKWRTSPLEAARESKNPKLVAIMNQAVTEAEAGKN